MAFKTSTVLYISGLAAVGFYLAKLLSAALIPPATASCDSMPAAERPSVVIYGASWCTSCKKTRWFFDDAAVAYCEYDIETSAAGAQQYDALGGKGIPLIKIGQETVIGYNTKALTTALRRQGLL